MGHGLRVSAVRRVVDKGERLQVADIRAICHVMPTTSHDADLRGAIDRARILVGRPRRSTIQPGGVG